MTAGPERTPEPHTSNSQKPKARDTHTSALPDTDCSTRSWVTCHPAVGDQFWPQHLPSPRAAPLSQPSPRGQESLTIVLSSENSSCSWPSFRVSSLCLSCSERRVLTIVMFSPLYREGSSVPTAQADPRPHLAVYRAGVGGESAGVCRRRPSMVLTHGTLSRLRGTVAQCVVGGKEPEGLVCCSGLKVLVVRRPVRSGPAPASPGSPASGPAAFSDGSSALAKT